ncbi:MAG: cell division protein FtsA [Parvularculaceae bacterium]|nr:cell division protein FtsA [Parvularculaceae bacterium]
MVWGRPIRSRDVNLVAAVDVGESKAACLIAHIAPDTEGRRSVEIVGAGLHGAPASERGAPAAAENALRAAVDAAERMAGERVRSVLAAVNGRSLLCRRIGAEVDLVGGRVSQEDVDECLRSGGEAAAADGCVALHAAPIRFLVDGEETSFSPIGLAGAVLTAEILGVGANEATLLNADALIERCGLAIERRYPAPAAAAEAVLIDDEKELGCILIDIGAASAGFAVYERGALVDCGGVRLGGDHITRDIAQIFGTELAHAERVKTLYGSALAGVGDEHKLVDFPQLGDESDIHRVSRAEVSAVITPRLEEILEKAAERLSTRSRCSGVRRVVLTGGGSLLVGARETAERVLKVKARLGRPTPLAGAPDAATAPQFSVCAGLIELAAAARADRTKRPLKLRSPRHAGGLAASVGGWLKDNF